VTRGGTKDLLVEETVSRANEHVSTPESSSTERWGPEPQGT
jgi:hypothetical protein